MKLSKIILTSSLVLSSLFAAAQDKEVTAFNPHWYVQGQFGVQETLGETSFGKLLSPTGQLAVGYNFSSKFGARFALNAWQSKAAFELTDAVYKWKWNYVAPMVDATFNLSNLFCGFDPNRVVDFGVFGGIGANIAWGNDEAADAQKAILANKTVSNATSVGVHAPLEYLWDGSKAHFAARLGANVDFRVSEKVKIGVELSANTLSDRFNSKKAGNPDWYFNALVGAKIALGKTYTTKVVPAPKPVEKIIERIIEKPVVAPVKEEVKEVAEENFRRDIFFTIGNSTIAKSQRNKISEIVTYMQENPDAKITLTGYADKGTGSAAINDKIAARRAQTVYNTLAAKGVAKNRMIKKSMGSRVQPFEKNAMNRVTICIAK